MAAGGGAQGLLWPVVEANRLSRRLAEGLGGVIVDAARPRKGAVGHPEIVYRLPGRPGAAGAG